MYCLKKTKRSFDDLFKEYDCRKCSNYLSDEVIKIGYNDIHIYYLENGCKYKKRDITYNKKSKLIFKDIVKDYNF